LWECRDFIPHYIKLYKANTIFLIFLILFLHFLLIRFIALNSVSFRDFQLSYYIAIFCKFTIMLTRLKSRKFLIVNNRRKFQGKKMFLKTVLLTN